MQFTPPMGTVDEFIMTPQYGDARDPSHSPTPTSTAASSSSSSCPPPDDQPLLTPYSTVQAYPIMASAGGDCMAYLPAGMPPLTQFHDALEQSLYYRSGSDVTSHGADCGFSRINYSWPFRGPSCTPIPYGLACT
jgi:hypothetical protein